jgi:uncharacterized membrane protein YeiB
VFRPTWSRIRGFAAIAVAAVGLWVVWMLAQAEAQDGQLFAIHGPADVADRVTRLNEAFAVVSQITLFGLAIGFGIALVVDAWRLVRSFQVGIPGPEALPKG